MVPSFISLSKVLKEYYTKHLIKPLFILSHKICCRSCVHFHVCCLNAIKYACKYVWIHHVMYRCYPDSVQLVHFWWHTSHLSAADVFCPTAAMISVNFRYFLFVLYIMWMSFVRDVMFSTTSQGHMVWNGANAITGW